MNKKIILIGGTAGSGKTSVARELKMDHRIGTGFIREIIRTIFNKEEFPELYTYTFSGYNPIKTLIEQSKLLRPFVLACINRARKEGTSLVIEGTHILPHLYENSDYDYFIILNNKSVIKDRLCKGTHSKRKLSKKDFIGVKLIAEFIMEDAIKRDITIVDSNINFEDLITNIKEVIHEKRIV